MIKKSLYVLCTASILNASATMCYKKEHLDPSTIESVALNGGECKGVSSVLDMKSKGYEVDSMKIQNGTNGFNYIYVFQKETEKNNMSSYTIAKSSSNISDEELKARIEQIQKTKEVEKIAEEKKSAMENGKNIYATCIKCHGVNGEKYAHPAISAIKDLTLDEFKTAIRDYDEDEKDNGMAILMKPYSDSLTSRDIEDIYHYLKKIN